MRFPLTSGSDDAAPEGLDLIRQQELVDAVLEADGAQTRLAPIDPPTYRVRGVRPVALDSACAAEGDAVLRVLAESAPDPLYLPALAEMAGHAHRTRPQWKSASACALWVYYKWVVRHLRMMTALERARYGRVADSLYAAQQATVDTARLRRVEQGVMRAVTPKEAA
jgi:hypothetical protein